MTELESPEEITGTGETTVERISLWQRLLPWISGTLAFIFGLIWFLPLNQLAREALTRMSPESLNVELGDIRLGVLGGYDITNLRLASESGDTSFVLSIPSATGRLSLWGLLLGNFNFKSELQGLQIKKGVMKISGGVWSLQSSISGIRKSASAFKGDAEISASSFLFVYDEPLPMLDETLEIPVAALKLQGKVDQGVFKIQSGALDSRLAKVSISGSAGLSPSAPLDIGIVITPTEELFQKYQDKGLREILKSFKLLQADGRIQFQLSGTVSRPVFRSLSASENP